VLWEDNYVSLLPGETRVVTANYRVRDLGGAPPMVVVTGWNVRRTFAR
jgi:exo-1,4-beta-D-glucosaminidase